MVLNNDDRVLAFTPAYKLMQMMKLKKISQVELVKAILRRIEEPKPETSVVLLMPLYIWRP